MDTLDKKDFGERIDFDSKDDDDELLQWNKDHSHTVRFNQYNDRELNIKYIKEKHTMIKSDEKGESRKVLRLSDIVGTDKGSIQQREVVISFLKICGLWTDEEGNFIDSIESANDSYDKILLVPGPAGTGKSFVIDVLYTELKERWMKKNLSSDNPEILVCAPTGKAALAIGGYTIQGSDDLKVPVEKLDDVERNNCLKGSTLTAFQARIMKTISVILDEFSMISSKQMFWIHKRLQEGSRKDLPFGGMPIIIFGDPGQIAPVGGSSLWLSKTVTKRHLDPIALLGHQHYTRVKNVLYLTQVRRQHGRFRDMLLRLRDGKFTHEDWSLLLNKCCYEMMSNEKK